MIYLKLAFFASIFTIFYVYLGYPFLVSLAAQVINKKIKRGSFQPNVTIIISAYNEEKYIEETIRNKLTQDYPRDKLEIIVVSDGSTDKTDEIVKKYEPQGVKLLRQEPRAGKTAALNMAVSEAKGEILVFSDANSIYDPKALITLARNFNDPKVGYVTGRMIYVSAEGQGSCEGSTIYMKYENFLRENETKLGSIVGVNGGIDAIRKSLFQPMGPDQLPDFVLPLKVVEQGYRAVYEPEAILREASLNSSSDEYRMRVRVSLRSLWALSDMRRLLSLREFPIFAWQLWSHKVLRYLCFIFLICAYLLNLALWPAGGAYKVLFAIQSLAYFFAALHPVVHRLWDKVQRLYFLNYFLLLNLAAGHAFVKFLMGQKQVIWAPRKG